MLFKNSFVKALLAQKVEHDTSNVLIWVRVSNKVTFKICPSSLT